MDVVEKICVTFKTTGELARADISGLITIKSFLLKNPQVKLYFEDNLVLDKKKLKGFSGMRPILDDWIFHPCVNANTFEKDYSISFFPPQGEFCLMKYRASQAFHLPFRLFTTFKESENKVALFIKVRRSYLLFKK